MAQYIHKFYMEIINTPHRYAVTSTGKSGFSYETNYWLGT